MSRCHASVARAVLFYGSRGTGGMLDGHQCSRPGRRQRPGRGAALRQSAHAIFRFRRPLLASSRKGLSI